MKKLCFAIGTYFLLINPAFAQSAFQKRTQVLQAGVGYGLLNSYGDVSTPPISLTLDFAASEDLSVGGYVGYASSREVIYTRGYLGVVTEDMGATYSYFIFGGRVCYHFDTGNKKLDGYIGAMLGYNAVSATGFGSAGPYKLDVKYGASVLLYGGQLGGRYFFTPNVALFAEVGYGVGYVTGGLSLKI